MVLLNIARSDRTGTETVNNSLNSLVQPPPKHSEKPRSPLNAQMISARLSFLSNLDVHVNNALTHTLTKSRRASDSTRIAVLD
jgi:hypothetical protein